MVNDLFMPKHLVFSGGGIKGLSQVGAVKKIEEIIDNKPLIDHLPLKTLNGSSIGSVIATLLSIGYTAEEILEESKQISYESFNQTDMFSFIENYGFDNGMQLHSWIINSINKKIKKEGICATIDYTFKDLHDKSNVLLNITATCLNTYETHYFNHENSPDMPVSLAIRMSCSLPFIFEAIPYKDYIYTDGSLIDDLPCNYIDKKEPFLAFKFKSSIEIQNNEIKNIEDFSKHLMFLMFMGVNKAKLELNNINEENTIYCDSPPVNITDFNISTEQKTELYEIGYKSDLSKIKFFKKVPPPAPPPEPKTSETKEYTKNVK